MIKGVVLIGFGAVLASMLVCKPSWLSDNTFLKDFVSFEILSLLAVILTVTLASVANIHLSINRIIVKHFSGRAEHARAAEEIKSEIKQNAWVIFYSFFFAVLLLFVKGLNESETLIVAICNGAMLWILLLNLMCILDIYRVIYGIVDLESSLEPSPPKAGDPDFTSEGPS